MLSTVITYNDILHIDVLKAKIAAGANPNQAVSSLYSALELAAKSGLPEACQLLLDAGADPNFRSGQGNSPLAVALANPPQEVTHEDTLLIARMLLERGANPNGNTSPEVAVKPWHLPIVMASQYSHLEAISLLARYKADLDVTFTQGSGSESTPLDLAFQFGKEGAALRLIEGGASKLSKHNARLKPLHMAIVRDMPQVVEHLLRAQNEDPTSLLEGTDESRLILLPKMRQFIISVWQSIQSERTERATLSALGSMDCTESVQTTHRTKPTMSL